MESAEATTELLKNKFNLHKAPEVDAAAVRTRQRTGEKVPQDPLIRIQNYLDRINKIINPAPLEGHPGFDRQERNLDMLKGRLHDRFIVKPNEIPESYWENQRRLIRERGQGGDLEHVDWEQLKRQNTEAVIADQRSSLDKWVDYFASPDSSWVPDPLKYYAFRGILNMGEYDKEKKIYPQRSKGTTKPFPDLNREALAYVLDALNKKYQGQQVDTSSLEPAEQQQFEKLMQGENFAKLYGFAIEKVTPASAEDLSAIKGEWIKYNQGSDHISLVQSLQGHGTGWCTAGESTAQAQLRSGDFYVYYSYDRDGKPTVPRAAIRMEDRKIAEVRGIAADQNLDTGAVSVVEEKLKEFPDGELYKKRVHDMELLTAIENKTEQNEALTGDELAFLYEIDSSIEGFGYNKDPRINDIRSKRDVNADMPIVLGCERAQITGSPREINPQTKAYVGKLEPGIFDLLSRNNIDQIYTSFPEGKIRIEDLAIGGKSKEQLQKDLKAANIQISGYAQDMKKNSAFTTLPTPETIKTVKLKVEDLGLGGSPTTAEIIGTENDVDEQGNPAPFSKGRMTELGLELCPPEVGVYKRLKDTAQPLGEWCVIGMKPITDRDGAPRVFALARRGDGLWLDHDFARPDDPWRPAHEFVFSLRKSAASAETETQKLGALRSFLSSLKL